MIVLIADIYHRAIMLPRLKHEVEMRERERQLEAERVAASKAGEVLNSMAGGLSSSAECLGGTSGATASQDVFSYSPHMPVTSIAPGTGSPRSPWHQHSSRHHCIGVTARQHCV